jgi:hypothetical protein
MTKRACQDCEAFIPGYDPASGACHWLPQPTTVPVEHWCMQFRPHEILIGNQSGVPVKVQPSGPTLCGKVYRKQFSSELWGRRLCKLPADHEGECGSL